MTVYVVSSIALKIPIAYQMNGQWMFFIPEGRKIKRTAKRLASKVKVKFEWNNLKIKRV